jgi:Mg2+ and Co2+ transporter CorA
MKEVSPMLKDALGRNGYNIEEKYFHEESRRQIEALRKDPLKIRRLLRSLQQQSEETSRKSNNDQASEAPHKKVA